MDMKFDYKENHMRLQHFKVLVKDDGDNFTKIY